MPIALVCLAVVTTFFALGAYYLGWSWVLLIFIVIMAVLIGADETK